MPATFAEYDTHEMAKIDSEASKLVIVQRFRDLPEASIAKSILDSAGVENFLADDNMVRLDWFYSNLVGGIKILVREEDVEAAAKLLTQEVTAKFDVEDAPMTTQKIRQVFVGWLLGLFAVNLLGIFFVRSAQIVHGHLTIERLIHFSFGERLFLVALPIALAAMLAGKRPFAALGMLFSATTTWIIAAA